MMTSATTPRRSSTATTALVTVYGLVVIATVGVLAVLTARHSASATTEDWIHAGIVTLLAVVLVARLRSGRSGSRRGMIAVAVVAGALLVANVVEALLPGLFSPGCGSRWAASPP